MKSKHEHVWGYPASEYVLHPRRICTKCGMQQRRTKVVETWSDDGFDELTLDRINAKPRDYSVFPKYDKDPYTGENRGLGMYVRSQSHFKELVKERNLVEVGNERLPEQHKPHHTEYANPYQ